MKNKWLWILLLVAVIGLAVLIYRYSIRPSVGVNDVLNADGVRDDVAKAIAQAFPESEKKRAAATQLARATQMAIETPERAVEIDKLLATAESCLDAIDGIGPYDSPTGTNLIIRDFVVNSRERSKAYIKFNAILSGNILSNKDPNTQSCQFDPSRMRN